MVVCDSVHTDVTIINSPKSSNFEFLLGTLPYSKVFIICSNLIILEGCSDIVKVVPEDYALEKSIQQLALHQNWVESVDGLLVSSLVYLCNRGANMDKVVNGGRPSAKKEDSPKEKNNLNIKDNLKKG